MSVNTPQPQIEIKWADNFPMDARVPQARHIIEETLARLRRGEEVESFWIPSGEEVLVEGQHLKWVGVGYYPRVNRISVWYYE